MRELLLRLEAERFDAPGRSGPATVYFREWKRRVLLRNPRFALKYLAATRSEHPEPAENRPNRANDARFSDNAAAPAPD
jgi:hypothetical protein